MPRRGTTAHAPNATGHSGPTAPHERWTNYFAKGRKNQLFNTCLIRLLSMKKAATKTKILPKTGQINRQYLFNKMFSMKKAVTSTSPIFLSMIFSADFTGVVRF